MNYKKLKILIMIRVDIIIFFCFNGNIAIMKQEKNYNL